MAQAGSQGDLDPLQCRCRNVRDSPLQRRFGGQ
jgi:hypothetical protein